MSLSEELAGFGTLFMDTAPVIYYIEAHPELGPLAREVVESFRSEKTLAFSSVITLAEVLPKPIEAGNEKLAKRFAEFLVHGKNFVLIEISSAIAERAGRLRGRYPYLKTADALQVSAAMEAGAEVFVTNDGKLKKLEEINVIVLGEYK